MTLEILCLHWKYSLIGQMRKRGAFQLIQGTPLSSGLHDGFRAFLFPAHSPKLTMCPGLSGIFLFDTYNSPERKFGLDVLSLFSK